MAEKIKEEIIKKEEGVVALENSLKEHERHEYIMEGDWIGEENTDEENKAKLLLLYGLTLFSFFLLLFFPSAF